MEVASATKVLSELKLTELMVSFPILPVLFITNFNYNLVSINEQGMGIIIRDRDHWKRWGAILPS
jgi:hypothetical protein